MTIRLIYLFGEEGELVGDVKPRNQELIKLPAVDIEYECGGGEGELGRFGRPPAP